MRLTFVFATAVGLATFGSSSSSSSQPGNSAPGIAAGTDHHGWLGTETIKTRVGDFEFNVRYPTPESAQGLHEQLKFNRAVEIYLDQLPAVSIIETRKGVRDFGAKRSNQAIIWEQLMDAQTLVLTPNTETV